MQNHTIDSHRAYGAMFLPVRWRGDGMGVTHGERENKQTSLPKLLYRDATCVREVCCM